MRSVWWRLARCWSRGGDAGRRPWRRRPQHAAGAARRNREHEELPPSVPPPIPTLAPTRGISGPRLRPGAVLCRSREPICGIAPRSTAAASTGMPDPGDPLSGCHLVRQERGVEVVSRHGLGTRAGALKPTPSWLDRRYFLAGAAADPAPLLS